MELDDERPANGERPYAVGYGKPPADSRFRPGVSGNPRGRPVGSKNLATMVALANHEYLEEEAMIASWNNDPPPKSMCRRRKRS